MASRHEVFVRPTEIVFTKNANHSIDPVEVLVGSKSDKILQFKIFATTRSKYSLSKCKGVLKPGELVRITIQVIRSHWIQENRRDFFKLQFFDCSDDSLIGDRYICSTIWINPTDSSYQSLESDSCSSWPSREHKNLNLSPYSRVTSVGSGFDLPLLKSQFKTKPDSAIALRQTRRRIPSVSSDPKLSVSRSHSLSGVTAHHKRRLSVKASEASAQSALTTSRLPTDSQSRPVWRRLLAFVRSFVFVVLVIICIAGISLPLWAVYARDLLPRIRSLSGSHAFEPSVSSICYGSDHFYPLASSSSAHCSLFPPHHSKSDEAERNADASEFAQHSRMAIHSLRGALWSLYGALVAIDPLTFLPNLSWFCLGLLIMFHWTRTGGG